MPLAAYRSGALGGGAQRERRLRSGAGGLFSHAKLRFLQGLLGRFQALCHFQVLVSARVYRSELRFGGPRGGELPREEGDERGVQAVDDEAEADEEEDDPPPCGRLQGTVRPLKGIAKERESRS